MLICILLPLQLATNSNGIQFKILQSYAKLETANKFFDFLESSPVLDCNLAVNHMNCRNLALSIEDSTFIEQFLAHPKLKSEVTVDAFFRKENCFNAEYLQAVWPYTYLLNPIFQNRLDAFISKFSMAQIESYINSPNTAKSSAIADFRTFAAYYYCRRYHSCHNSEWNLNLKGLGFSPSSWLYLIQVIYLDDVSLRETIIAELSLEYILQNKHLLVHLSGLWYSNMDKLFNNDDGYQWQMYFQKHLTLDDLGILGFIGGFLFPSSARVFGRYKSLMLDAENLDAMDGKGIIFKLMNNSEVTEIVFEKLFDADTKTSNRKWYNKMIESRKEMLINRLNAKIVNPKLLRYHANLDSRTLFRMAMVDGEIELAVFAAWEFSPEEIHSILSKMINVSSESKKRFNYANKRVCYRKKCHGIINEESQFEMCNRKTYHSACLDVLDVLDVAANSVIIEKRLRVQLDYNVDVIFPY
eukprot:NODE_145_length_17646_cov_0.204536.p2 type:complete len:470 gc:universal NODE_145_length_17646_cov_0.204536:14126-12717(-)